MNKPKNTCFDISIRRLFSQKLTNRIAHTHILPLAFFLSILPLKAATPNAIPEVETIVQAAHFIQDFDISPDGKHAVTCNANSVALWDIDMRRMVKRISIPTRGKVRFDPLRAEIAYISDPGKITASLRSNPICSGVNLLTGQREGSMPEKELEKRNSYHDKYIFKLNDGKLEIRSRKDRHLIGYLDGNVSIESGRLDISPNDSLVALGGPAPIVWDIRNAKIATVVPYSKSLLSNPDYTIDMPRGLPIPKSSLGIYDKKNFHYGYLDFSRCKFADDNTLFVGGYADDLTRWDLSGASAYVEPILSERILVEGSPVYDFAIVGDNMVAATYKGFMHKAAGEDRLSKVTGFTPENDYLSVYCLTPDPEGRFFVSGHENSRIMKAPLDNPDAKEQLNKTGHAIHHVTLTPDRKSLVAGGQMGILFEIPIDGGERFEYDTRPLQMGVMQGSVFISPDRFATVCKDGSVSFWTKGIKQLRKNIPTHLADTYGIGLTSDGRHLITSDAQGSLRFWNPETEELIMSAFLMNDRKDYIFLTPDNYYKASKGVHSGVQFAKGLDVFPFEQFDLRLNRPDIILQRLGAPAETVDLYHQAWLKRLRKMGFTEKDLSGELALPTVALLNERELDNLTEATSVNLNFTVSDPTHTLKRVFVNLNGVPLLGRNGKDISAQKLRKYTSRLPVELGSGNNTIEIFAINSAGAESLRKTIEISGKSDHARKPDLYVIAIGVSDYTDRDYNLKYAAKDAKDLASLFEENHDNFGRVEKLVLTDAAFTPTSLTAIKNFALKAKRDDTVVLFYAGHGLLDNKLNYYLSHHSINFSNPSLNGIPYEKFEALLDGTKALNRLVMIDACHSGEIDKEDFIAQTTDVKPSAIQFRAAGNSAKLRDGHGVEETRMLFNELFMDIRWGSGSTVISSSGGLEVAYEGDQWNNGLFTWCLKNGLSSKRADRNSDGTVSSTELGEYLCDEVARLSEGVQIPTLRTQNIKNDFIIIK